MFLATRWVTADFRSYRKCEAMRPGDLLFQISQWKSHGVRPADAARVAKDDKQHLASMGYRRYQKSLQNAGAVDFDDLLLCTEDLFQNFADTLASRRGVIGTRGWCCLSLGPYA